MEGMCVNKQTKKDSEWCIVKFSNIFVKIQITDFR